MLASVAHPGRQHSRHVCEAFVEAASLSTYYTSFATPLAPHVRLASGALARLNHWALPPAIYRRTATLSSRYLRWMVMNRLRGAERLEGRQRAWRRRFDEWTARRLRADPCDLVIGYENSCLDSFRAARSLGKVCVLDAASFHHSFGLRLSAAEDFGEDAETRRQKDEEIDLAHGIITLSQAARQSYLEAGIEGAKVRIIHPGVDLQLFSRAPEPSREGADPFRVLFVGAMSRRKGFDLLLSAFDELPTDRKELWCVGDRNDTGPRGGDPRIRCFGFVDQRKLPALMSQCDLLALPSRFDSFGMVVTEAMACAMPVLVSTNVGAGDLVADGAHGWIVAPERAAVKAGLTAALENRAALRAMGRSARASIRSSTWARYRRRFREECEDIVREARSHARGGT